MRHKTTQTLYSYWNGLRGVRMAPRRFEIEPGGIGDILPDTFILERHDAGKFLYRLAGTRICDRFGREFRGRDFLEGWAPEHQERINQRLNTISVQGGAVLLDAEAETATGKTVNLEIAVLPLLHTKPYADRFLGCVSVLETPNWLCYEPLVSAFLTKEDIVWPDGQPHPAVEPPGRQEPFLPHIRRARIVRQDRRQFRVFDGGLAGTPAPIQPNDPVR